MNALFRIAQGKLDLLQQILVDNHLGRLPCNAFRDLCQIAGTDIQHIGIEMHIAIGGMVKGKLTQELVVQLTAPALEVTDVGHLTVHVAVGLQDGFLKTVLLCQIGGDGGGERTTQTMTVCMGELWQRVGSSFSGHYHLIGSATGDDMAQRNQMLGNGFHHLVTHELLTANGRDDGIIDDILRVVFL